jgi:hypothetical protein
VMIGFYLWVLSWVIMITIPLILIKKGKPMTIRDLLFFFIGMWAIAGKTILFSLFN